MAKPSSPRDSLIIEFDTDTINEVVQFIRSYGFECVPTFKNRDETLPKGVYRRIRGEREYFVVKNQSGNYRNCLDVGDAIEKQGSETATDGADETQASIAERRVEFEASEPSS